MNTAPKFELAFVYRRGAVLSREDRTTRKSQTSKTQWEVSWSTGIMPMGPYLSFKSKRSNKTSFTTQTINNSNSKMAAKDSKRQTDKNPH